MELRLGDFVPRAPVVLAPMAGVTNAPFRALCRRFGPGLVYVNEMVMATALVHGNAKTARMVTFDADEHPRSLQVYGSDPAMMGRAVDGVCDARARRPHRPQLRLPGGQGHAQGRRRRRAGEAGLLRAIVRAAVTAAAPYGVPVTAKFRIGLHDGHDHPPAGRRDLRRRGRRGHRRARPHRRSSTTPATPAGTPSPSSRPT